MYLFFSTYCYFLVHIVILLVHIVKQNICINLTQQNQYEGIFISYISKHILNPKKTHF